MSSPQELELKKGIEAVLALRIPPAEASDKLWEVVQDEAARFAARVLKRAINEIPEDKLKDGILQLWDTLSELSGILGPELMQEIKDILKKSKDKVDEWKKRVEEEEKEAREKFVEELQQVKTLPPTEKLTPAPPGSIKLPKPLIKKEG